jgi:F420-dependent oxidoreductase-like protein
VIKLGVSCTSFTWNGGDVAIRDKFAAAARGAEERGLHSFWVMDHLWQIEGLGEPEEPMLESYTALAYAAALTERVTLGTLVTGVPYRPPGLLVKEVTTLDVLSGGRAVLGIGAGWNHEEARGLGLPFPPRAERFGMLEEVLRIARQMWDGDQAPVRGRHFELDRPLNSPASISRPHPLILVGGNGERKTLRLVAQYADACNLFEGVDVPHKLKVLREHCEAVGRSYEAIEKTLHFRIKDGEDPDDTFERCAAWAADGIEHVIAGVPDAAAEAWQDRLGILAERLTKVVTTDDHGIDH